MKRLVFFIACAAAVQTPALAQSARFYVGGGAAYVDGRVAETFTAGAHDVTGGQATVFAGLSVSSDRWQGGLEIDGAAGDVEGAGSASDANFLRERRDVIDRTGSVRARLGYAFGGTVPYVTGGLSMAHLSQERRTAATGSPVSVIPNDATLLGYAAGLGVEHQLSEQAFARLEYRHARYWDDNSGAPLELQPFKLRTNQITAALGWRF